eukprot:TRINITY_DN1451_c0_g2_i1.p1 TRINITY_DN1451_c0_g2~~TRINITY_DN1451_c0_g2_i1.p1  ORF type:complete len:105 (+),score=32.70 TRINITY_DN1451_c0_g2_i1:75-389(+)
MASFRGLLLLVLLSLVSSTRLRLLRHQVAKNDTNGSPDDSWHKDLGKGLKPEHDIDTKDGQTNATHTYDSVDKRTKEDLSYEAHKKAKEEAKKGNSSNSTNSSF